MISETWQLGAFQAIIELNHYGTGSGPAPKVQYKTGNSKENCEADTWHDYNGISFTSQGWIKVRIANE